ncbi:MAG: PAS domain-containing protein, partial [Myxococcota bacterium]
MESLTSLPWKGLVQGVASLAILGIALWVVLRRLEDRAATHWILGWATLLGAGVFTIASIDVYPPARFVAHVAESMMAPFLLMGALEIARRPARGHWPLWVGLVAGLFRCGLDATGRFAFDPYFDTLVSGCLLLATAHCLLRAPDPVELRRPIAALLVVYVLVGLVGSFFDVRAGVDTSLWRVQLAVGFPLLAAQVGSRLRQFGNAAAVADRARHDADRARHDADRARAVERDRVGLVFAQVHDLVADLDADSRILFVNDRVRDLLGIEPEGLVGLRGVDFLPEQCREASLRTFRRLVREDGLAEPHVLPVPTAGQERRFLEFTFSPYDYSGARRMLAVGRDVTARVEAERSLAKERDRLVQSVAERDERLEVSLERLREQERLAAIGSLAAGVAHQINNPVGAISAAAEFALLSSDDPDAEKVREDALQRVVEESARAGRIVKSLLRFARPGPLETRVEDLTAVVRLAVERVGPYARERGATVELEGALEDVRVAMSPIEVEQALVHLLHNAAEATRRDGRIVVRLTRGEARVTVEVVDHGVGMSAETRSQVFDPFFTTRLRLGGAGL